ncbi:helix-turn-helix transcriptional regulator [Comamonas piscis]|uniref:Helix-turn-helix transcriptional regulator n=1 Tax=Comamonas piscis TaxID=1562974 RepID=A0A7G5EBN9_9BURK|nr:helix-turn-helix transcriptional regulator [Comamonas piscis]QMV71414.1 helix-turn-helix transcriptional regulator [Comamonas piscis]WSO34122.1 helix-turn-helix transcriptional regulator [Comamonas piscis]
MAKKREYITKRVGNRIAELRQSRNWSQAELAFRLQVEPETIDHLECGTSTPSLQTLESLATALQVRISDLVIEHAAIPDQQAMQIRAWLAELDPADHAIVTGVIQQLCERMRARGGHH